MPDTCTYPAGIEREGKDLPEPSRAGKRRPLVNPPVQIALKAALYEAWRQAGISQRRLARDLDESELRRMLNPENENAAQRPWHQGREEACSDLRPFPLQTPIPSRRIDEDPP